MTIFDTSHNSRQKWIDEIKELTGETDDINAIQFCLSYTLQSLKYDKDEVFNRFKWEESNPVIKKITIDKAKQIADNIKYEYYYDKPYMSFSKALEKERQYRLNCSDFPKDLSNEATMRRMKNYMKRGY